MDYVKPEVTDYGTIEELTLSLGANGSEDGAIKAFHGTAPLGK